MPADRLSVEYVGWRAVDASCRADCLQSIANELLHKRRHSGTKLKKQSLEFDDSKLRVYEVVSDSGGRTVRHKRPSIPASDIGHVQQDPDSRLLCLVLLGFNEDSGHSVHAHAWLGRSAPEVSQFAGRVRRCLDARAVRRERRRPSDADDGAEANAGSLQSVTAELRLKLSDSSGAPLLHPPRDYDTLRRSHGNVMLRCTEAPLSGSSQAPAGAYIRRSQPYERQRQRQQQQEEEEEEEPAPDYDDSGSDTTSLSGSRATSLSQSQHAVASLNSSEHSFSDHSADPVRGFSTWRRRSRQQQRPEANRLSVPDGRRHAVNGDRR